MNPREALQLSSLTTRDQVFVTGVNEYQVYVHAWAKAKGFWQHRIPFAGASEELVVHRLCPLDHYLVRSTKLMLMVSELGEALESVRMPSALSDKILAVGSNGEAFTVEEEELADAMIRIMDYAGAYGLRLGEAIIAKMAVNEGRPFRHGKAF